MPSNHPSTTVILGYLYRLLAIYVEQRHLGYVGMEKTLITLTRNDCEPDVVFFGSEKTTHLTEDQMKFPAPDLAVEVLSPSTEHRDRGIKKQDYAVPGVGECWIVDPVNLTIEQHELVGDQYRLLGLWNESDFTASCLVSGFRIPVRAAFDAEANLAALNTSIR